MGSTTPPVEAGSKPAAGIGREVRAAPEARRWSVAGSGAGLAPVSARRRPWLIGLGALLASVGALVVVWLIGAAGQRQEVLAVRMDVAYGGVLSADDVALARVSVDPGVSVIPGSQRDLVVGQVATTTLAPGMILSPSMISPDGEPGPGRVLVPVAVASERMPAGGLRAGDRILAIDAESEDAFGTSATVVRVGPMDINGITVVDVTAPSAAGPQLAVAAANGRVALVVEPNRS